MPSSERPRSLAELVASRREELGLSLRDVAAKSRGKTTASSVSAVERGTRTRLSARTLDGLAQGLELSAAVVRNAAGFSSERLGKFRLPSKADELNGRERRLVLEMVDALLAARQRPTK